MSKIKSRYFEQISIHDSIASSTEAIKPASERIKAVELRQRIANLQNKLKTRFNRSKGV